MNNMIKGAVFDLDHTLFDRYATQKLCMKGFCEYFDVANGMTDEIATELVEYADKHFNHYGWEKIFEYVVNKGTFKTVPSFESYCSFLLERFKHFAVPYEFTKPMLQELKDKGLKLGIITNGKSKTQRSKIKLLGFEEIFDEIIVSEEVGAEKPDTKPFEIMSERLGIAPENLIYVGDFPVNDIEASRKAGYTPVWVRTTGNWYLPELERAPYEVDTVAELPELLAKIDKK